MNIYDMHVHAFAERADTERLLSAMGEAGVSGGCVFSNWPKESNAKLGTTFEERLEEVLSICRGHEDRLFPVLWIHPAEKDIINKLHIAVNAGIAAFKMICTDYYVSDEPCMTVLREIARLGKPVIFHTGILWDGEVSSRYNRPLNWEALLDIDGLRFSMGHCSWPWIDECIALYGKFLNALHNGKTAEMFFDITPGTPPIYRRELLSKLYTVGYNVGDNVLFGTDSTAHAYRAAWTQEWLDRDGAILDELGVSRENREKLYETNLFRFLGKSTQTVEKVAPVTDDSHAWSPISAAVRPVIEKWYRALPFAKSYDNAFHEALDRIPISDAITLAGYDKTCTDGRRNLLSFLYLCEATAEKYRALGIPEDILLATLQDIPTWTVEWSNIKGELYLGELSWLTRHLDARLFRLGRLQFCMAEAEHDIPGYGIQKGDSVIEVHIPSGGKLDCEAALASLDMARAFFAHYFPDYSYTCFTCHSWLLDDTLKAYLPPESNIVRFGDLFDKVAEDDSYGLIRYLFRWDTTVENLPHAVCNSGFSQRIKSAVLGGVRFHETLGVIAK